MIFVSAVQIAETDHLRGYEIGAVDYVHGAGGARGAARQGPGLRRALPQDPPARGDERRARDAGSPPAPPSSKPRPSGCGRARSAARSRSSAGDMGSWEVDLATGHIEWDDGPYRIFGVDPNDLRADRGTHRGDDPSRRPRQELGDRRSSADGEPRFQVEFRIVRPSGEVRWCYGAGIISRDAARQARAHERRHRRHHRAQARRGAPGAAGARGRPSRQEHAGRRAVGAAADHAPGPPPEFISTVEGRIHALAATHNLLSATRWEGADLRKIVDEEMAPYHADHRQRVVDRRPGRGAAAGDGAGRGAGAARACDQRRQVRRAVDRHRHAAAHLVDRARCRSMLDWLRDRRPADRRAARRWASASPSCAPASRRSSAAASSTTGGPRACTARCSIPSAQIASPVPAPPKRPRRRRQPTIGARAAASPTSVCWWSRTSCWSACWSRSMLDELGAAVVGPYAAWPTALAAATGRALRRRHSRSQSRRRAGRSARRSAAGARRAVRLHHRLPARQHRPALRQRPGAAEADRRRCARTRAALAARHQADAAGRRLYGLTVTFPIVTQPGSIAALAISTKRSSGQALSRA